MTLLLYFFLSSSFVSAYLPHAWLKINKKTLLNFKIKVISRHLGKKMERKRFWDIWGNKLLTSWFCWALWRWMSATTHGIMKWEVSTVCIKLSWLIKGNGQIAFKYQLYLVQHTNMILYSSWKCSVDHAGRLHVFTLGSECVPLLN
jgi:hypothetical protein